ncbi:unnamed protein product [Cercospora beticola]|nr:unnamed protein product [Cercospora beticola]
MGCKKILLRASASHSSAQNFDRSTQSQFSDCNSGWSRIILQTLIVDLPDQIQPHFIDIHHILLTFKMKADRASRLSRVMNPTAMTVEARRQTVNISTPSPRHSFITVASKSPDQLTADTFVVTEHVVPASLVPRARTRRALMRIIRRLTNRPPYRRRPQQRRFVRISVASSASTPATPSSARSRRVVYSVHIGPETKMRSPARVRRTVHVAHPPCVEVHTAAPLASAIATPLPRPGMLPRTDSEKTPFTAEFPGQVNPSNIAKRRGGRFVVSANMLDGLQSETGVGLGKTQWLPSTDRGHSMANAPATRLPYIAYQSSMPGTHGLPSLRSPIPRADSPPLTPLTEEPALPEQFTLPYLPSQQPLSPTEFEYSPDYYVQAYDERKRNEREKALAALEGKPTINADEEEDETDLPVYLRGLRIHLPRSADKQQSRVDPSPMPQQICEPPTPPASVPTSSSPTPSRSEPTSPPLRQPPEALSRHTRFTRQFDNCDFDHNHPEVAGSVRSFSIYSTDIEGQRISQLPAQPYRPLPPPPPPPAHHSIARKPLPRHAAPTFIRQSSPPKRDTRNEGHQERPGAFHTEPRPSSSSPPMTPTFTQPRPAPTPAPRVISPNTAQHRLATLHALEANTPTPATAPCPVSPPRTFEQITMQRPEPSRRHAFHPLREVFSRWQAGKKQLSGAQDRR